MDQNGAPFTDQNLKGKTFLVFFGFTHCPDVCPTTLFEISEIMRKLGSDADRTAVLFITVDPERDTPESIKDYLASFDPHIRGLTGDAAALAAVAKAYRVYYKKVPLEGGDYTMDHTAIVYLMGKDGQFRQPLQHEAHRRRRRRRPAQISLIPCSRPGAGAAGEPGRRRAAGRSERFPFAGGQGNFGYNRRWWRRAGHGNCADIRNWELGLDDREP